MNTPTTKYLISSDSLKTMAQGALGAMTFGMYHQYITNNIMELNNKQFKIQYQYDLDKMNMEYKYELDKYRNELEKNRKELEKNRKELENFHNEMNELKKISNRRFW
jgi:chromosome segregation ATPase